MHESFYLRLHTVTAFMFQDENDIYVVTFMQLRDPTAFMFQEWSTVQDSRYLVKKDVFTHGD